MISIDKTVTISLEENSARRKRTEAELAKLGLETTFFLAVRDVQQGERGCFTSHVQVSREALKSGCRSLLVFEDDVKILPYTEQQIEQINKFITYHAGQFDVLYLGLIIGKMWYYGHKSIVRASGAGAHAYILSLRGMQKMAAYEFAGTPIDKIMKHHFKCYSIYPIIAEQYPETQVPSDISPHRTGDIKDADYWQNNYAKQKWILWKNLHKTLTLS